MDRVQPFEAFLDMLRRHALLLCVIIAIGAGLSVLLALAQPQAFRSTEVIQIAQSRISADLVPATVRGESARRLQLIRQQTLSRESLREIIAAYELYAVRSAQIPDELVDRLRASITIDTVFAEGGAGDGTVSLLRISAEMPDPEQARQVAQELGHRLINLSIRSRISQARDTAEFLAAQEARLMARIGALEDRIVGFRRSGVARLDREIRDIDRDIDAIRAGGDPAADMAVMETLEQRRLRLSERRAGLRGRTGATRELAGLERRLQQLTAQLDEVSARKGQAETGLLLETQRLSERLSVIEPASLPVSPVDGMRKRIVAIGVLLSVIVALLVARGLDLRNPAMRDAAQMFRQTGLHPIATIPVSGQGEKAGRGRGLSRGWGAKAAGIRKRWFAGRTVADRANRAKEAP